MKCRHCDTEIDTRIREADGSVVCPGCGAVYRQKNTRQEPAVSYTRQDTDQSTIQSQRQHTRRASNSYADYRRPVKHSKAPIIIAIVVAFMAIACGVAAIVLHLHSSVKTETSKSDSPIVEVGKQSIPELINTIIGCVNEGSDFQRIADCFDCDALVAYSLIEMGEYRGSFAEALDIVKNIDNGIDYLSAKYPGLDRNSEILQELTADKNFQSTFERAMNEAISSFRQFAPLPQFDDSNLWYYNEEDNRYVYSIKVNDTKNEIPIRSVNIEFYVSDGRYIAFLLNETI